MLRGQWSEGCGGADASDDDHDDDDDDDDDGMDVVAIFNPATGSFQLHPVSGHIDAR